MDETSTPEATAANAGGSGAQSADHSQEVTTATSAENNGGDAATSKSDQSTADAGQQGADKKTDDTPAPKFDADLDDWAEKRGYGKLETDRERRMAQDARNNQRNFHQDRQTSEKAMDKLESTIKDLKPEITNTLDDVEDPLKSRVDSLEATVQAERENTARAMYLKDAKPEELQAMTDILDERVKAAKTESAKAKAIDLLTSIDNLPLWYELAQARVRAAAPDNATEIENRARAEERERLAKEQQADVPNRSASSVNTKSDTTRNDALMDRWSKRSS